MPEPATTLATPPPAPEPHSPEAQARPCQAALDPRIRRTREQLQHALATLLQNHDFERVSVHDITAEAGVNRATFYAHYPDKYTLLECMVATRFHALLAERGVVAIGGCSSALRGLVLGVCDFLAQSLPHNGCPSSVATPVHESVRPLQPHMETAVIAVVRHMILDGMQQHAGPATPSDDALRASAISWAIYGAAREWANTPHRAPSEEIATTVVDLITPLLAPATMPI